MVEAKKEIKELLTRNLYDAISSLKQVVSPQSSIYNKIVMFEVRYNSNKKHFYENTIGIEDYNLEQNRLTLGLLNLIDEIELFDSKNNYQENQKYLFAPSTQIVNIQINEINRALKKVNHQKKFQYTLLITLLLILIIAIPEMQEGWQEGKRDALLEKILPNPNSKYSSFSITDGLLIFFLILFGYQFYKYLQNRKNWELVGQKILNIEMKGNYDYIIDLLFFSFKKLKIRILDFNRSEGVMLAKTNGYFFSKMIEIKLKEDDENKKSTFDMSISCNSSYPSITFFSLKSNQSILNKIKTELITNSN